ncbi:MAG: hypothetical protein NVS3B11_25580 [Collimonas sp.]
MQFALASYVCPGMAGVKPALADASSASASASMMAMVDCAAQDMAQPALCHTHAHDPLSKQSPDQPQWPDVPPFVSAGMSLTIDLIEPANLTESLQDRALSLTRTTSPPIAIRHCCFRI